MQFQLYPIIDTMLDLYSKPRSRERFQEYLSMLQGEKRGELLLPIGGFNPMAKEHLLIKLTELKDLRAEEIIANALQEINTNLSKENDHKILTVVINLADDLKGGWTNKYTTDFDSKFKINALVNRSFCTPYFWTSEIYNEPMIKLRALEYVYRTMYWLTHSKPILLRDYIEQEIYVAKMIHLKSIDAENNEWSRLHDFYIKHADTSDYSIIFNFLYGDEASKALSFSTYGNDGTLNGYDYAYIIANKL